MKIRPVNGLAADLSSSLVIFAEADIHSLTVLVRSTVIPPSLYFRGWCFF